MLMFRLRCRCRRVIRASMSFLDFNLLSEAVPVNAVEALNDVFPEGLRAIEIYPLTDGGMPLRDIAWSKYRITWSFADGIPAGFVQDVAGFVLRATPSRSSSGPSVGRRRSTCGS